MRILFAIPHYFNAQGGGGHASLVPEPRPRVEALAACLAAVHQVFGREQRVIDIFRKVAPRANQEQSHELDVVVCTTGDAHVLKHLPLPSQLYRQYATQAEPKLLGFECRSVLRDALGRYDYYAYLEDDLILHDPWFFAKLAWFTRLAGFDYVLQPNRYEMPGFVVARKVYVDGDLRPGLMATYRDLSLLTDLHAEVYGAAMRFVPAKNPHSGCYFLNSAQMAHWAGQPHFLDRDTSFIGPLESAATLGLLRTFKVYKPAIENAAFLELQHYGTGFLSMVGTRIPLEG